jgi:hypothetical protein
LRNQTNAINLLRQRPLTAVNGGIMRLLRKKVARAMLGIGQTKFNADYIKTGRIRTVPISERIVCVVGEDIDTVIAEKIAERETAAASGRIPQARDSASGRFVETKGKAARAEAATP